MTMGRMAAVIGEAWVEALGEGGPKQVDSVG